MRTLLPVFLCAFAMPAQAALLKPMTILHAQTVRLSDLFGGLPAGLDRVLGPGPQPGGRIVVEAPQLAAIARQFGVDWQPSSAGDRAVLERPGHPIALARILAAVQAAMRTAGASNDTEISMPGFVPPIVPFDAKTEVAVAQLDYDASSDRFTAILSITGAAMEPINLRIGGEAIQTERLPVAATTLAAGAVLRSGDIRIARVRTAFLHDAVAMAPAQALGLQLRHPIAAGQPLPIAALVRPSLVQKGADVLMQLDTPGITLTAEGQALQSGAIGDHIRVLNPASRAIVDAEVLGPGRVRITPGILPIVPAGRPAGYGPYYHPGTTP